MKTEIIGLQGQRLSKERATDSRRGADPAQVYARIVERYAMLFDRPEVRLRFLNNTIAKQVARHKQLQYSLRHFRFLQRTRLYDWLLEARFYKAIMEELRALAASVPNSRRHHLHNIEIPLAARAWLMVYQIRHAFYAGGVMVVGLLLFGLYSLAIWSAGHVNTYLEQKYQRGRGTIVVTPAGQGSGTALAATGGRLQAGYKPENVWLVERTNELERYSNGARILTRYEVDNHPRGYYVIPRGSETEGDQPRHDIVGIVYHTSESDIVPFTADNNLGIQKRSQWLIEYIRRNKAYNYLIDRYGEIYRIVRDDHAAHHAGHSIWADSKYTYIGLNESFIGICFESTVNSDSLEETLTQVQITRGRELTHVLRSLYKIDDANCTTHGIVSVNPDNMLIARHHDWVRNFPFEAMDLSDKYKILPPNISDYGFTYDQDILEKLNHKLWEGAIKADREFIERAERANIDPDILRRKLRDLYFAQLEKVRKLRTTQDEAGKSSLTVRSTVTNSPADSGNN